MNALRTETQEAAKGGGRLAIHTLAIVLGLILSVTGLAMGVSIALLPIGIPLGLVGLALLLWGLFGAGEEMKVPPYPPA
jgi:uncharacterized membrane protein YccF (DUF307 family)